MKVVIGDFSPSFHVLVAKSLYVYVLEWINYSIKKAFQKMEAENKIHARLFPNTFGARLYYLWF